MTITNFFHPNPRRRSAILVFGLMVLLLACGGGDSFAIPATAEKDAPTAEDAAMAADLVADPNSIFAGDEAAADCFSARVFNSFGEQRLRELGLAREGIPLLLTTSSEDFRIGWTAEEIDVALADLAGCVDPAKATRDRVTRDADEMGLTPSEKDCLIDTLPADHVFENLRGELYGNIGENKAGSVLRDVAEDW
ncbi:MAG: hypothetical protein HKN94_04445, partial [Acidimicrobiales bacterium]|nr:hypothetical protein [Acidimicrobiales bacterium]